MLELNFAFGATPEARWHRDGHALGSPITLDGPTLRTLDEIRSEFARPFDRPHVPLMPPEEVRAFGRALYEIFFRPIAAHLPTAADPGPHTLLIRSADPGKFNLPWELIELPGRPTPIGCDPAWAVFRVPAGEPMPPAPADPGPLRLLFLVAAPEGDVPLDYEREEEAMLRATERLDKSAVVLPFAETGGIDELAQLVTEHRPHVVHLSGHGTVSPTGVGYFAFENERGRPDSRSADQIAERVFRGSAVRCVVLNACKTGLAAATGLADGFVSTGVPVVLGWGASVGDDTATRFMTTFYRFLASGDSVPAGTRPGRPPPGTNLDSSPGKPIVSPRARYSLPFSVLLFQAVGSFEKEQAGKNLSAMCSELDYSQEQFDEMMGAVVSSYRQDRGAALLSAAFPAPR